MILNSINELTIVDVIKRGIPNEEFIAIRVNNQLNIAQYGLVLGVSNSSNNFATPIRDYFFWFGEGIVNQGDWIFIYTGSGESSTSRSADGLSNIYTLYWGKTTTVLHNLNIVPLIFRMDGIQVYETSKTLSQS